MIIENPSDKERYDPMDIKNEKEELVDFLVNVQKTVLFQKKEIKDTKFKIEKQQKEYFLFLIDVLDKFNGLYDTIASQTDRFDSTSLKVFRSFDIIRKKISHHLASESVHPIDLSDGLVKINLCEVVSSEEIDDDRMKGKIKNVLSTGYTHNDKVLKSTRVTTYR